MKCVILSIRPKYCELIASGKKTVEVRKNRPKIDVPFKCYIYCTQGKDWLTSVNGNVQKPNNIVLDLTKDSEVQELNGKVIGHFICDEIDNFTKAFFDEQTARDTDEISELLGLTCLTYSQLCSYVGLKDFYGWHISDLVIYDKPKELSEFRKICQSDYCHTCDYAVKKNGYLVDCDRSIKRPPQSWCYVEEILPPLVEPKGKTITIPRWRYNEHKGETE